MIEILSSDSTDSNGNDFTSSYDLTTSQAFSQARVGTEFGSSPWDASYPYTPPARSLKVAAYTSVDLTSYSGHTASLSSWWVRRKLLANTGQQSGRDWVAVPGDLYDGGASLQTFFVPQSAPELRPAIRALTGTHPDRDAYAGPRGCSRSRALTLWLV